MILHTENNGCGPKDAKQMGNNGYTQSVRKPHFFAVYTTYPFGKLEYILVLDGGNSYMFYFHPNLGKIPILTNILQMGWKPPALIL